MIVGVRIFDTIAASMRAMLIDFDNDEFSGGTTPIQGTITPNWNNAIKLGSIVCHAKSKKNNRDGKRFVDDKTFINKRKPSSTTVAKGLTKHTLCGIILFKLNTFLVLFLQVPSIDSTCYART